MGLPWDSVWVLGSGSSISRSCLQWECVKTRIEIFRSKTHSMDILREIRKLISRTFFSPSLCLFHVSLAIKSFLLLLSAAPAPASLCRSLQLPAFPLHPPKLWTHLITFRLTVHVFRDSQIHHPIALQIWGQICHSNTSWLRGIFNLFHPLGPQGKFLFPFFCLYPTLAATVGTTHFNLHSLSLWIFLSSLSTFVGKHCRMVKR